MSKTAAAYGIRTIDGVALNPGRLADDPRFPEDETLYPTLLDHLGKVDADRLWADALTARAAGRAA